MPARTLMVQGTMSSVGKSLLVAALCRIFSEDGWRVAPFKAQNMALNSYATQDGREVGRAQAMQADAAGVDVTVEMNPILIKPEADAFAQIVVMGEPWARLPAGEYMRRRGELWQIVTTALDSLRAQYDLVIMEGAGSPAELNLRRGDLVNMSIAEYTDAPVLLVGDIDRGGIFAQLLGTLALLEQNERKRVEGLIVNKFRGDMGLFEDGVRILEERGGVPVFGLIPFIHDLRIADEDSVALDERPRTNVQRETLDVAVIRLPHISNFDDFDPLRAEADVNLRFTDRLEDSDSPDLVILTGTKTTIADLEFLRGRGLVKRIMELGNKGVPILGICGGYQMLGEVICDPLHVESDETQISGLGLLPLTTTFAAQKRTERAHGRVAASKGLFANARDLEITGYGIHMGQTVQNPQSHCAPLLHVITRNGIVVEEYDGAQTVDGWIAGTYFHGLFENDELRSALLANLAARHGRMRGPAPMHFDRSEEYQRLAKTARAHLDLPALHRLLNLAQ